MEKYYAESMCRYVGRDIKKLETGRNHSGAASQAQKRE